jgi:hypothetical protein
MARMTARRLKVCCFSSVFRFWIFYFTIEYVCIYLEVFYCSYVVFCFIKLDKYVPSTYRDRDVSQPLEK